MKATGTYIQKPAEPIEAAYWDGTEDAVEGIIEWAVEHGADSATYIPDPNATHEQQYEDLAVHTKACIEVKDKWGTIYLTPLCYLYGTKTKSTNGQVVFSAAPAPAFEQVYVDLEEPVLGHPAATISVAGS